MLAALNHPNIAAIYGLEASTDVKALVMEFVEGPTLADRIADGPVPLDEALPIAVQIADALDAAHERGIIRCSHAASSRTRNSVCATSGRAAGRPSRGRHAR